MSDAIVEVQLKPQPAKLRLQWGLTVANGSWQWRHGTLQVRLYLDPFPDLGRPELLDMALPDTQGTKTFSLSLPFLDGASAGVEQSQSAFRPGTVFSDATGRCYPLHLDLGSERMPAGAVIGYAAVEWTVSNVDWLDKPFAARVVFGYEERGRFIEVQRSAEYRHDSRQATPPLPTLPDVPIVPEANRVRRHSTAPKLFISYAHANMEQVARLAKRLSREQYYDVWIDYDGIPGGSLWEEEISRGVQHADVVLFMMTPESCASPYCGAEIRHALKYNKKIIPVRLNAKTTPDALAQVGLSSKYQFIDYVDVDEDTNWRKLLKDLPIVLQRDRDLLDPAKRALHEDYLRSVFRRLGSVSLTYLLEAAPRDEVNLMDVYVPLFLSIRLSGEIKDQKLIDWWVVTRFEPEQFILADTPEQKRALRQKTFPNMQPEANVLELIIERMRSFISEDDISDGSHSLWRVESEEAPALQSLLVITGAPGSGKSTLLKYLALCMAGDMLGREDANLDKLGFWPHPAFTPVYIELRALIRSTFPNVNDTVTLDKILTHIEREHLQPERINGYLEPLREQMRAGDVMFFLDGLDEVPEVEQRHNQIKAIVKALRTFDQCRILVASRPYAYEQGWLPDFGQVKLTTLDADRLEELALRLFRVVLGLAGTEQEAEAFKTEVGKLDAELRGSPLFFTLMAALWLNNTQLPADQRLPTTRGAIYRASVEMLIRRWTRKDAEGKSTADLIGLAEQPLRQVLELLGYTVHNETRAGDDAVFKPGEIMSCVHALKLKGVNYDELLEALAQRAGIVYEKAPNQFQFAHRSIQEHLAACHLAGSSEFPANIKRCIQTNHDLWRDALDLLPDELEGAKLWQLIQTLLPAKDAVPSSTTSMSDWWWLYYALHWMTIYKQPEDDDMRHMLLQRCKVWLVKALELGVLPPVQRAELGRILAGIGDSRPGVGLRADGLPAIEWIEIPAGSFWYGSDKTLDPDARDNELPRRQIDLPAFAIAKYPVTYRQYQAFLDDSDFDHPDWWRDLPPTVVKRYEQEWKIANHPRENVSWYQAVAYTRWLSVRLGYEVRLPTEFEWERAARGTHGLIYPYGNEFDATKSNTSETGIGQTSAVGLFPDGAAPEGALDMSGNVWEWCLNKYKTPDDPTIDASGADCVLRGGAWNYIRRYTRAACCGNHYPHSGNNTQGFRLARSLK